MTLEEIKKLDAAWNYHHLRGQGIQIPTFDEFLGMLGLVTGLGSFSRRVHSGGEFGVFS